jgi:radical SAM protein with 4Fe4S-binding SPASM domain
LFVEPTNACNLRCGICPESLPDYREQAGYYGRMSALTWSRITLSLDGWCAPVVRFYHVGEPLLNTALPPMIRMAKALGCRTELTTNGTLLNEEWRRSLLNCGLDYMRISVYGTSAEDYERETGRPSKQLHVLLNAMRFCAMRPASLIPEVHAELVVSSPGQEESFYEQWANVVDRVSVKGIHNWGETLINLGKVSQRKVCSYPFYELAVKANGDVTVCCVDWDGSLSVGNVNLSTLREIWEGPRLRELQQVHLNGQRWKLSTCRGCNVPDTCPDNLDSLVPVPALAEVGK